MRVTLRGESSLDLSNNGALFVIDGVPMFNTSSGMGESAYAIDYGNGTGDINPDDIDNITVLKGPAATALYGSEAANGAIVITTKSGDKEDGNVSVTFSSDFVAEVVNTSPDLQYVYGQGGTKGHDTFHYGEPVDGNEVTTTDATSWGPKMDGTPYYQFYDEKRGIGLDQNGLRVKTPFVSYGNWFKDYFKTGWTTTNSLSLSAKLNRNNSMRLSISDTRSESITPNSPAMRQSIKLNSHNKVNNWLSMNTSITYYRRDCDNLPQMGYGQASVMYSLWCMAPNINMDWARDYWIDPGVQQNANLTGAKNNPYFVAYECLNTLDRDRIFGNTSLDLHLYKGLDLMLRGGIDFSRDHRTMRQPKSSYSQRYGMYREGNVSSLQLSTDFLLKYDRKLGAGFDMKLNFGGSIINRMFRETTQTAEQLKQPGVYSLANSVERVKPNNYDYERQTNSLYGLIQISWRDAVFLDITGRNDWSSTLAPGNNSYFYPSVGVSFLLDEALGFRERAPWVDMLKLRGSWANVGNDTDPYQLTAIYSNSDFQGGYRLSSAIQNYNIKPENIESWETGIEARLFGGRIGLDVAYYDSTTTDQIITVPADWATGAASKLINAGEVNNRGVEVALDLRPVETKNWRWDIGLNWSKNWNELVALAPGVEMWQLNSKLTVGSTVFTYAYPGGVLGRLYGIGYETAPEGSFYVDEAGKFVDCSGARIIDAETGNPVLTETLKDLGSIYPNYKAGLNTRLSYKGLSLAMTFTAQQGGRAYSVTSAVLSTLGKLENSLPGRYDGLIADGVNLHADGTYSKNRTVTQNVVEYYNLYAQYRNNIEQHVYSTSFLKLKELRLDYSFPEQICRRLRVVRSIQLGFFATNLFCWTKWPQYDPEVASWAGGSLSKGVETGGYPMTRTYGLNLKLTF